MALDNYLVKCCLDALSSPLPKFSFQFFHKNISINMRSNNEETYQIEPASVYFDSHSNMNESIYQCIPIIPVKYIFLNNSIVGTATRQSMSFLGEATALVSLLL